MYVIDDIKNTNHPCYGMSCENCETCIFDRDLFSNNNNTTNKMNAESCHLCADLQKESLKDGSVRYNAYCKRSMIGGIDGCSPLPRLIKEATGPMVELVPPEWCPKKRGVQKEFVYNTEQKKYSQTSSQVPKTLTYSEKRERLMAFPHRIPWDDIEEDGVYVIPKILSQSRKVVRVVVKEENFLRCSEIDEHGEESQVLTTIYPKDIDLVFITKVLKF